MVRPLRGVLLAWAVMSAVFAASLSSWIRRDRVLSHAREVRKVIAKECERFVCDHIQRRQAIFRPLADLLPVRMLDELGTSVGG
jgi:hypothetical protein